jgi:hypothetical protein
MSPLGLPKDFKHNPNHVPFTPLILGDSFSQNIRLPNFDYVVLDLIKKKLTLRILRKEKNMN